jgi:hypothetical protein
MTIDTNSNGEFREGVFFQWIDGCNEYAADAFNYDIYEKTGNVVILFTHTDIPSLENIVYNLVMHYKLDVDLFETVVLKDAFLMTLRYLIYKGSIDGEALEHANEWYFSDMPKFKVLELDQQNKNN